MPINERKSPIGKTLGFGHVTAIQCIEQVLPYLREPKKKCRAEMIADGYKKITIRNGRYSDQQKQTKLQFEDQFFDL